MSPRLLHNGAFLGEIMKKILFLLLAFPALAFGQETRTQATNSLMGLGMPGQLAEQVAGLSTGLGVISNNVALKWRNAAGSANISALNVNGSNSVEIAPSSTLIINGTSASTYFGGNIYGDGDNTIGIDTADAADNKSLFIGSGSVANSTRGASIQANGNEVASVGGTLKLLGGNVATGNIDLTINNASAETRVLNSSGNELWTFDNTGNLKNGDASLGGSILFGTTGSTISIQEGTPASACMGAATPNGNTPVAVSTTCATTGARVFYARAGAITNMGTISTTTAPSGSGFSFASTGASDTLASSVIWFIVKEAA